MITSEVHTNFDYSQHKDKFDSLMPLSDYLKQAGKIVKKITKSNNKSIVTDDLISYVVNAMVKADLTFDPNKGASRNTYRYKSALFTVWRYLQRKKNDKTVSFESDINNFIYDNNPLQNIIKQEELTNFQSMVKSDLSERDSNIVIDRMSNKITYEELGKKYNVSRQRAEQIVNGYISRCSKINYQFSNR